MRAGAYVQQPQDYKAFIPRPLPPKPPIQMDADLTRLLSDADRALGRLDGVATILPNPDLFVLMYIRHEAVLSSQIEGTESGLDDLLEFEASGKLSQQRQDVLEVRNYVDAMNYGLARLSDLPLSLRLLKEIHEKLMSDVRGSDRMPGQFRTSQNWIGPGGCTLEQADFVPPPPHAMSDALNDLEKFLHDRKSMPNLIHCALAHAQFETIHPFLDGNGRIGRLLITLLLCERQILEKPLLYLSYYLKAHKAQYYDRLTAIRNEGDWEGWVKFFLRGIFEVSQAATAIARDILALREKDRKLIADNISSSSNPQRLLDALYLQPWLFVNMAKGHLECSYATANKTVNQLVKIGILREITGRSRHRIYRYDAYLNLFDQQALRLPQETAR